jgi:hypothetical protein
MSPYLKRDGMISPPEFTGSTATREDCRAFSRQISIWRRMHAQGVAAGKKNYLTPEEQGFPLLMSLKGSIATLCMNIPDEQIMSPNGVDIILHKIFQQSPDDDLFYQLTIIEAINSLYCSSSGKLATFVTSFQAFVEKYIDVAGKLGPRIDELFALQMLRNANLDDATRANALTSAITHCSQSKSMAGTSMKFPMVTLNSCPRTGDVSSSSSLAHTSTQNVSAMDTTKFPVDNVLRKLASIQSIFVDLKVADEGLLSPTTQKISSLVSKISAIPVSLSTADLSSIVEESSDGIAAGYLPNDDKAFILDTISELSAEVTFVNAKLVSARKELENKTQKITTVYGDMVQMVESLNSVSACTGEPRAEWNVETVAAPSRITVDSMAMALKSISGNHGNTPTRSFYLQTTHGGSNNSGEMCDYKGCANPHRFHVKSKCWTKEKDERKAKAIASAASKSLRSTVAKPQGDESDSSLDSGN